MRTWRNRGNSAKSSSRARGARLVRPRRHSCDPGFRGRACVEKSLDTARTSACATEKEQTHDYTYEDIAKMIDHSLLEPTLTAAEMSGAAGWRSTMMWPAILHPAVLPAPVRAELAGSQVEGEHHHRFPHGCHTTAVKVPKRSGRWPTAGRNWTW